MLVVFAFARTDWNCKCTLLVERVVETLSRRHAAQNPLSGPNTPVIFAYAMS